MIEGRKVEVGWQATIRKHVNRESERSNLEATAETWLCGAGPCVSSRVPASGKLPTISQFSDMFRRNGTRGWAAAQTHRWELRQDISPICSNMGGRVPLRRSSRRQTPAPLVICTK